MKKLIRMIMIAAVGLALSVSAHAQEPAASPTPSQAEVEAKAALYAKFTENMSTHQDVAYTAAKEYVTKWPNDTDDIAKYLKDFVTKYEKALSKQKCTDLVTGKKWADAFSTCKELVASQPDDLAANLNLAWAGWQLAASGNNANNTEAINNSTRTIQMIEAGKTIEPGKPFTEKAKYEALGWLNFSLYLFSLNNKQMDAAAGYLIKSAQNENVYKNDPNTYLKLSAIYVDEFEKRRVDYTKYDGQPKTPEGDAAYERVKQEADLVIDAYARVIAYSGTDPKTQQVRDDLKKELTGYYKFRHGNVDGVDALIAGIKSKPIALPAAATPAPTPVGASTPASTPATVDNSAATETKPGTTTPATTTTPASSTTPKPTATPAGTAEKKPATAPAGNNGRRPRRR